MWLKRQFLRRASTAFLHDVVMAAVSFVAALYLRLGDALFDYPRAFILQGVGLFTAVAAAVFLSSRLYRGVWRYASLNDLIAIARAASLTILIFLPVLFLLTRLENLPRSFLVINWFVLIALLGASRFAYRVYKDRSLAKILARDGARRVPVLLVGAGDAAETFIRALGRNPDAGYRVVGVVDEKGSRVGRDIRGVEVLGTIEDIPRLVAALKDKDDAPQRLVLTKPRLEPAIVRRLLEVADSEGLTLARLPRLTDFHAAEGARIEVRPVAVEDLLGRPRTVLDRDAMKALIAGKRVLVTGAGGTIGGELTRQIAAFAPARLSLLDNGEFNLYQIDAEIAEAAPDLPRDAILGDVRDGARLADVMTRARPEIVFHAAALKHVPMVEANPGEGILTNVAGTRNLADACRAAGVAAMVMISTDKAVNPTSVMGATKRLAESYCQALDMAGGAHGTRFVTVRFGNVLGSTGSVVPLFQRQLAKGGPLTVTHPDMKRYFMTVREAVELVLQASALGVGDPEGRGRIYVLDMGAPVRIRDLAETMIRLAGLRPGEDVEIAYTGLRPGEKLFEELFHGAETPVPTGRDGVLLAAPRLADLVALAPRLDEIAEAARARDADRALALLGALVPEYGPAAAPVNAPVNAG